MTATFTAPSVDEIIARLGATSTCDAGLTKDPWAFESTKPSYGPGASMRDRLPADAPRQQPLPAEYRNASDEELQQRIVEAKNKLGKRLLILGHYYQRDEIVKHADFVGDSFQLSENATTCPDADYIVFCGVHFMAETADILSTPEQAVSLPNLSAGCSMADMANIDQVEDCWSQLEQIVGANPDADGKQQIVPVTYMNSSAALKAFCGRHGGIVCTSSNARTVLEWAFERGKRVLFFPDQHLGRNTGRAMGIPLEKMPMWDPYKPQGGIDDPAKYDAAKIILWKGFCSVHQRFTVEQIDRARKAYPGVKVIVHPECPMDVVEAADGVGSTAYIVKAIEEAPAGSTIAVGTEINMVNRLAAEHPDKTVFCLDPVVCPCSTMYRIHPAYLAWVLENLVAGKVVNRITVDDKTASEAKVALERMLNARPRA
ncbi:quinolinate synthase NadA [Bifidobacterium sp. ESL0790]|uniref:quinolinate synthase NadA n=1 Tax=Bifidobacterium sp. ESL0790 TaxID=2983233 RepID=UPI0023F9747A|nr:quinolinate synthase NadA [Bifidobacterium sp. ESL0790]WEV72892.1 quinolinate synthase NadA [Bifidobacterium sp. ESL0790]